MPAEILINDFATTLAASLPSSAGPGDTATVNDAAPAAAVGRRSRFRVGSEIVLFEITTSTVWTIVAREAEDASRFPAVSHAPGATVEAVLTADGAAEAIRPPLQGHEAENKDTVTLAIGTPVAVHSSGVGVIRADATNTARPADGLAVEQTAAGFAGYVQTEGQIELADWSTITGSATLAARAIYYLGTAAGTLTTTAPTTSGHLVQRIGRAVSATRLDLSIGPAIRRA